MGKKFFIYICIILGICIPPLFAEFSILSTVPADGAVSVDTVGVLSVQFNQPLDTTALFETAEGEFFLGSSLYPLGTYADSPDSISLSADSTTVFFHNLHLSADTKYVIQILGARSVSGDTLSVPVVVTFTTGDTLGTCQVSGTISFPDGDPAHSLVYLLKDTLSSELHIAGLAVADSTTGHYTIPYVEEGAYILSAVKDKNGDKAIAPFNGDPQGWYDPDADGVPNAIQVTADVSDIDMTLSSLELKSAHTALTIADAYVKAKLPDASLVSVRSVDEDGISTDGTANVWLFQYNAIHADSLFSFVQYGATTMLAATSSEEDEVSLLPSVFVGSDEAVAMAEQNGGNSLRATNSGVRVSALLQMEIYSGDDSVAASKPVVQLVKQLGISDDVLQKRQSTPIKAVWTISYAWTVIDDGDPMINFENLYVDAVTGQFLSDITAKQAYDVIKSMALEWADDAGFVISGNMDDMDESGRSREWLYFFYSPKKDMNYGFFVTQGVVSSSFTQSATTFYGIKSLMENWIDSDSALKIFNENGGSDFIQQNSNVETDMIILGQTSSLYANINKAMAGPNMINTILIEPTEKPAWIAIYNSASSDLVLKMDALSGNIFGPKKARTLYPDVSDSAKSWAADAALVSMKSSSSVSYSTGKSSGWRYIFYSPSLTKFYEISTSKGVISRLRESARTYSTTPIPETWVDSDSVLYMAEYFGASDFLVERDGFKAYCILEHGLDQSDTSKVVWEVRFSKGSTKYYVYLDATSGNVVTDIQDNLSALPTTFFLEQNFPNPFNPTTVISYQLPVISQVQIDIYNTLGQKINTLFNGQKEAGVYEINWDGTDQFGNRVGSGIYFYQLQANDFVQQRKMILMK